MILCRHHCVEKSSLFYIRARLLLCSDDLGSAEHLTAQSSKTVDLNHAFSFILCRSAVPNAETSSRQGHRHTACRKRMRLGRHLPILDMCRLPPTQLLLLLDKTRHKPLMRMTTRSMNDAFLDNKLGAAM